MLESELVEEPEPVGMVADKDSAVNVNEVSTVALAVSVTLRSIGVSPTSSAVPLTVPFC